MAVIMPALVGFATAYRASGQFSLLKAGLALIAMASIHLGSNLLNDYFDYKQGADLNNPNRNQFSGGSRHIVSGIKSPRTFLIYGVSCLITGLLCGVVILMLAGSERTVLIGIAVLGILLGYFYTAPPLKLAYRGLGEVTVFICFGLLPMLAALYVLAGNITGNSILLALPFGFLVTNIIWINEFPDHDSDKAARKNTLVVKLTPRYARTVYYLLAAASYGIITFLYLTGFLSQWIWPAAGGLVMSTAAAIQLHRHYSEPGKLLKAQSLTIAAHSVTGIGLLLGILFR